MFQKRSNKGVITSSIIGGVVGAASVMMFTTDTGKQVMKRAKKAYPSLSRTLLELGEEWKEEVDDIMNQSKSKPNRSDDVNEKSDIGSLIEQVVERDEKANE
ncbi:YtxH domain-containing protein [Halalkalibacter sp. APA_J-10(15)]|uniref:YtxH domain-containing protein n=1 Tax=unclassified Halalkalibacter TaxID=2893063 RepID=UPI001FF66F8F|nr:YtxH domain-containing protein [Halalkalibacter sp. APA_J-10(15)]MCK0472920.1 YtxH domain-containing protein [Halalkalibacter sp. APA_J-10(15)]